MHPVYGFSLLCAQLLQTLKDDNSHSSLLLPPCALSEKLTVEAQGRGIKMKVR